MNSQNRYSSLKKVLRSKNIYIYIYINNRNNNRNLKVIKQIIIKVKGNGK